MWTSRFQVLQAIFVHSFALISEELTNIYVGPILSQFNAQIESTLKPSNHDAKPEFLHVYRTKVHPRRFL